MLTDLKEATKAASLVCTSFMALACLAALWKDAGLSINYIATKGGFPRKNKDDLGKAWGNSVHGWSCLGNCKSLYKDTQTI